MRHFLTISLIVRSAACAFAQTADEALSSLLDKLETTTLRSDISITVSDRQMQPFTYNGTLEMRGELFSVNIFGSDAAYDGKTLYLYSEDTDELTLTTPTTDELTEANPILFARALRLKSKARFAALNKDNNVYNIEIIPDFKEAGVRKITLRFSKTSLLPQRIEVVAETETTTLLFRSPSYVTTPPVCTISHPDATIVDLR